VLKYCTGVQTFANAILFLILHILLDFVLVCCTCTPVVAARSYYTHTHARARTRTHTGELENSYVRFVAVREMKGFWIWAGNIACNWYGGGIIFWCESCNVSEFKYNFGRGNKPQLDSQLILCSMFRQPVHASGVSRLIIRGYNRSQPGQQTVYYKE
jgi:hypothetical protein